MIRRLEAVVIAEFQVAVFTYDDQSANNLGTWTIVNPMSLNRLVSYFDLYDDVNEQLPYAASDVRFDVTLDVLSAAFTSWFLKPTRGEARGLFD